MRIGGLLLYYYLIKGEPILNEQTPSQAAAAQNQVLEPKKFSKKSQRIHEARKKRGGR